MLHGDCSYVCRWRTLLDLCGECLGQVGTGLGWVSALKDDGRQQWAQWPVLKQCKTRKGLELFKGWGKGKRTSDVHEAGPELIRLLLLVLGEWVWEHLTLLSLFQSQLRLWKKNIWRAATPWIHWKLRVIEIGGVRFTRTFGFLQYGCKTHAWKNISDGCKILTIHTPESNFQRENMYHCSNFDSYLHPESGNSKGAESSASLPQFYWPGASSGLCVLFIGFHRAMGSVSVVSTPVLIYLAISILTRKYFFQPSTPQCSYKI